MSIKTIINKYNALLHNSSSFPIDISNYFNSRDIKELITEIELLRTLIDLDEEPLNQLKRLHKENIEWQDRCLKYKIELDKLKNNK
jgi:hypothetical protein